MIESLSSLPDQALYSSRTPYDFQDGDPRKLHHLSLEQQKKRARELLNQWHLLEDEALLRARRVLTCGSVGHPADLKLSDAQYVIAREYRFKSWSDFKSHIENTRIERKALEGGNPVAMDADMHTLHIRCGTDIQHALCVAGFAGDFMPFADPYVQGPVPATDDLDEFISVREKFLADVHYATKAKEILGGDYESLARAKEYQCVALWFEHDSHDLLILARLLDYFSDLSRRPDHLQFICVSHFPGVKRFNGIGHLPPEAMRVLWSQFSEVGDMHLELGRLAWQAITASTPELLNRLVNQGTPAIPAMAVALQRHLQQLPSGTNGLSLTEQLSLQILADKGDMNAARLFGWYVNHYEPLPFLGDTGYWWTLEKLSTVAYPAIVLDKKAEKPIDWQVCLTATGHDLLAERSDWVDLNGIESWLGGTRLDSNQGFVWRYDGMAGVLKKQANIRV